MMHAINASIKEFLEGLKANKEGFLITTLTTAISMAILGIFLMVFFNLHEMVGKWREKFQIVVYLKDDIPKKELNNLKGFLKSRQEIEKFLLISKEEALVKFKNKLNDLKTIMDKLESNPLPASFELVLKKKYRNFDTIKAIAEDLKKFKGIEDLEYGKIWLERLETILFFLKFIVIAIGGFICLGIIFIISNTIKLSLYSRKDEIEIMQLVGATDWFIKRPFLLQGMIQGLLGVILSIAILYGLYLAFIINLQTSDFFVGDHSFLFIPPSILGFLILLGLLIGCVGSYISLRKFLNN
jgi:cell division transport system permease protein